MLLKKLYVICLLMLTSLATYAQVSTLRCKWLKPAEGTEQQLDSLSLVPGSIRIGGVADTSALLRYDINSSHVTIDSTLMGLDSIQVCYRVFPFNFGARRYHRDMVVYDSNAFFKDTRTHKGLPESREQLFATQGLHKNGSISRGISFGNTQSVFVNSALNLQMEGRLSDKINILAVISDQNIPFQPEGNTQQLQEFDKVFIQLQHDKGNLTAGDIVLQQKPSHFLKYYKNVQGGAFTVQTEPFKGSAAETSITAAVSKGKFHSAQVPVLEGVQGPYRLTGPNQQTFIIIMANSERVFLDGRLLERGFNNDYVIDYNQAEITFTNKVLITRFSRLRIDFEYAERNYGRTILSASHYQKYDKLNVFFNHYQEADNPNNPLTVELDTAARRVLSEIGDDLSKAVISGAQQVPFTEGMVLYTRQDTILPDGRRDSVFVHTTSRQGILYQVVFSDVGAGRGDYAQLPTTANGRVFKWVGPGMGNFMPVRVVATPNRRRMTNLGASYDLTGKDQVYTEVAFSEFDKNLFSDLDSDNNKGMAYKIGYINKGRRLPVGDGYTWTAAVDYEALQKHFSPIDRFRDIEFDRDWSASAGDTLAANDHLVNINAGIRKNEYNRINYTLSLRDKGSNVRGSQQRFIASKSLGNFQIETEGFMLRNLRPDYESRWERLTVNTSYRGRYLVPGYQYSVDNNRIMDAGTDFIRGTAMNFTEHKFFVRNPDTLRTTYAIDYSLRTDNLPQDGELKRNTFAQTFNAAANSRMGKSNELGLTFTYRNLENLMEGLQQDTKNEETIMGRLDWNADLLERHIRSELTFASATGRELKREFQFLLAPPGQGTHILLGDTNQVDRNDINNYVPLNPNYPTNNTYYKVFIPTNEYVLAYTNTLNYRLNISAPRKWIARKDMKGFLARFSNVSSWSSDKKITSSNLADRFIPFVEVDEELLLATQDALRSTLFFNRTNPRYGADFNYLRGKNKQLLTNGFETRVQEEYRLTSRVNLLSVLTMQATGLKSVRANTSNFLATRNYTIQTYRLAPELSYQPVNHFRLTGMVSYADKKNIASTEGVAESGVFKEAGIETRFTKVASRMLQANVKYTQIRFTGEENTPLGYEILEALRPGHNLTWNVQWQQKLTNGLQINVGYEGRKSEQQATIHLGRMQVSALF